MSLSGFVVVIRLRRGGGHTDVYIPYGNDLFYYLILLQCQLVVSLRNDKANARWFSYLEW